MCCFVVMILLFAMDYIEPSLLWRRLPLAMHDGSVGEPSMPGTLLAASGNHHSPSLPALAALTNMVVNNPCLHLPLAERLLPYLGENFTAIFPLPCDGEGGKKAQTEPTAAVIALCTARMLIHCATSLYLHCAENVQVSL